MEEGCLVKNTARFDVKRGVSMEPGRVTVGEINEQRAVVNAGYTVCVTVVTCSW